MDHEEVRHPLASIGCDLGGVALAVTILRALQPRLKGTALA